MSNNQFTTYAAAKEGIGFANGYAHLRFKALTRAMRELPLDASALEITTRADSLLYAKHQLVVNPDGSAYKDPHWNFDNRDRRRKKE
jgi:hypothetical protein